MRRSIFFNGFFAFLLYISFAINVPAQTLGWGLSSYGRLGFSTSNYSMPTPQIVPALPDATSISGGDQATFFLRANGTVASAGGNNYGVLGTGSFSYPASIPASVINLADVVQVGQGYYSGTALKADGTVWSWGANWSGQLGIGYIHFPDGGLQTPTPQQSLISNVVQISAGATHTLALKSDGTVWAWGEAVGGGTGTEVIETLGTPRRVGRRVSRFRNLIAVSAGDRFSLALKDDGTVWVWGFNRATYGDGVMFDYYSLGQGTPRQVPAFTDVVQIAAGAWGHVLALKRDGTVWGWGIETRAIASGRPGDYRIGSNGALHPVLVPTQIPINDVVEIKTGDAFSLVRKRDGSVWAWGGIHFGELGTGAITSQSLYYAIPYPVQTLTGTGNAFIGIAYRSGYAGKPVIQTPVGFGVRHYGENVQMLFSDVTTAGATSYTAIDPTATNLNVPPGYAIQPNEPAYNLVTTAQVSGETEVCVKVNEYNRIEFPLLKILHAEGANWIDRTFSSDYTRRQVCARVDSLSSFVIAKTGTGFGK